MESSLKLMCFAIALAATALLFPAPQAPAWDADMVPVWPPEHVLTAVPGGGARTLAGVTSVCLRCRCCSKSNLTNCQVMNCCSHYDCDPNGNCIFLQQKCGCSGC